MTSLAYFSCNPHSGASLRTNDTTRATRYDPRFRQRGGNTSAEVKEYDYSSFSNALGNCYMNVLPGTTT
eukprot:31499-Pelagococcus_subviridis.AAC.54